MTPTARTLQLLRQLGYVAGVVERFIVGANVRRDLFGCIDVLAVHPSEPACWPCNARRGRTWPTVSGSLSSAPS